MNIGLLGFGVVGRGVYEITNTRDDMQVTKVLCLEDIQLPDAESVKDIRSIVEDPSIDTVVALFRSGDGCVGNFLSCRKGVKDPLEVPGVRCD